MIKPCIICNKEFKGRGKTCSKECKKQRSRVYHRNYYHTHPRIKNYKRFKYNTDPEVRKKHLSRLKLAREKPENKIKRKLYDKNRFKTKEDRETYNAKRRAYNSHPEVKERKRLYYVERMKEPDKRQRSRDLSKAYYHNNKEKILFKRKLKKEDSPQLLKNKSQ